MNTRMARLVGGAVVVALLLAGCGAEVAGTRLPECGADGYRTTVLMVQSVPGASRVPCMRHPLPVDWQLVDMDIDSAGSRLTFTGGNMTDWPERLEVLLRDRCDTSDAIAVTTDEVGTRRLEHIDVVRGGYTGERHYTFAGGCVTYRFSASGDDWTRFVRQAANLWTFTTREQVMRRGEALRG